MLEVSLRWTSLVGNIAADAYHQHFYEFDQVASDAMMVVVAVIHYPRPEMEALGIPIETKNPVCVRRKESHFSKRFN